MKTPFTHLLSALACTLALTFAATAAHAMSINEKGTAGTKNTTNKKEVHLVQPTKPEAGKVKLQDMHFEKTAPGAAGAPGKVEHSGDPHEGVNGGKVKFNWNNKTTKIT